MAQGTLPAQGIGRDGSIEMPRAAAPAASFFAPATPQCPARVCVVAEIGVNHDGEPAKALTLVEAAARAGADAVKLQLFDPAHLLSNQAQLAAYQRASADDVYAMLASLRLDVDAMLAVKAAAHEAGLRFIVTPFSLEVIDALRRLDPDAVKIASPDAVNRPLLTEAASLGRPMLVSTGTCELEELDFVAELVRDRPACLLHCVSSYPTPVEAAALGGIGALAERFGLAVGYSDHTVDVSMGALAVAAGACVIEKHLTYDRRASGPDHAASLEPDSFALYAMIAHKAAQLVGPTAKTCSDHEREVRRISRQSICLRSDLPAGHVLQRDDLTVKRPGTGIPAARLDDMIGRRLCRDVRANDLLDAADLVPAQERDVA